MKGKKRRTPQQIVRLLQEADTRLNAGQGLEYTPSAIPLLSLPAAGNCRIHFPSLEKPVWRHEK